MNPADFSNYSSSPETKMEQYSPSQFPSSLPLPLPTSAPAPTPASAPAKPKPKSKPRKRVNTDEKRHQHNAVERQRRENLNGSFYDLGGLIPELKGEKTPSKASIINGSIKYLTYSRKQRLLATKVIRQLCAERDQLAKAYNELRASVGMVAGEAVNESGWTEDMEEVCQVENETFGEFVVGEDGEGDDDESMEMPPRTGGAATDRIMGLNTMSGDNGGMMGMGIGIEAANAAVSSFNSTGLITPRSSTDIDPSDPQYLTLDLTNPLPGSHIQVQRNSANAQTRAHSRDTSTHVNTVPQPIEWPTDFSFSSGEPTSLPMSMSLPSLHGSSGSSIPFGSFTADPFDNLSNSPTGSGSMFGIPTPPTTGDNLSGFTHTPSPGSSGSYEDRRKSNLPHTHIINPYQQSQASWIPAEQQRLFMLHALQQQQLANEQQSQYVHQANHRSSSFATPQSSVSPIIGFNRSQSADSGSFPTSTSSVHLHGHPYFPMSATQMQQMYQIQGQPQPQPQPRPQQQQQLAGQGQVMSAEQKAEWRHLAMQQGRDGGLAGWAKGGLKGF